MILIRAEVHSEAEQSRNNISRSSIDCHRESASSVNISRFVDMMQKDSPLLCKNPLYKWKTKLDEVTICKQNCWHTKASIIPFDMGCVKIVDIRQKKKIVMLPSSGKFEILGRSVGFVFDFFFFLLYRS